MANRISPYVSFVLSSELAWFDEHPRRYTRSCRKDKSLDGTRYFYDQFEMFVTRQEETVKSHPTGSMYFRNLKKMFARRGGENHWIPADRGYYVVTRVGKSFEIRSSLTVMYKMIFSKPTRKQI